MNRTNRRAGIRARLLLAACWLGQASGCGSPDPPAASSFAYDADEVPPEPEKPERVRRATGRR